MVCTPDSQHPQCQEGPGACFIVHAHTLGRPAAGSICRTAATGPQNKKLHVRAFFHAARGVGEASEVSASRCTWWESILLCQLQLTPYAPYKPYHDNERRDVLQVLVPRVIFDPPDPSGTR